jgi:hypothetical protein
MASSSKLSNPKIEHMLLGGILIIILFLIMQSSQSTNYYQYIFNTMLGRALMIFFIVFITHYNPIIGLGAAAMLIIIHNNMSMVEGFTDTTATASPATASPATASPATASPNMAATTDLISKIKDKLTAAQSQMATPVPTPTATATKAATATTIESFSNIRRHYGQDRISSEQNIRSKSSRSLLGALFSSHGDPSPNFPDNHGFSGLFGSV